MAESPHQNTDGQNYEAFLQHFTRDRDRLYAFICSLVANRADAEDIFQKCSVILWRKYETFRTDESFLAWACGVAHFEVRNHLRSSARDRLQFDSELVDQLAARRPQSLAQRDQRLSALNACLAKLTREQRHLLEIAYGKGSVKQWAESTGSALQSAYNQLSRMRRQLLACVKSKLAASF